MQERFARLVYAGEDQFLSVSGSGHATVTGYGEKSTAPSPMELVLVALAGCTGSDVHSILIKKRQRVTGYEIEVRGLRRDEHPRIYTEIELVHRVKGDGVDAKAVADAIRLSEEKYCSVSGMLRASVKLISRFEIVENE